MSFDDFHKRFVSFGLSLTIGLFAAGFLYEIDFSRIFRSESKSAPQIVPIVNNLKNASGGPAHEPCYTEKGVRCFPENSPKTEPSGMTGVKILTKPRAKYTDAARANVVQGKVVLRVTFLANGEIGAIKTISGLPDGLTEAAIESAKEIKFEPATRYGEKISVTKPVEYNFTIY